MSPVGGFTPRKAIAASRMVAPSRARESLGCACRWFVPSVRACTMVAGLWRAARSRSRASANRSCCVGGPPNPRARRQTSWARSGGRPAGAGSNTARRGPTLGARATSAGTVRPHRRGGRSARTARLLAQERQPARWAQPPFRPRERRRGGSIASRCPVERSMFSQRCLTRATSFSWARAAKRASNSASSRNTGSTKKLLTGGSFAARG